MSSVTCTKLFHREKDIQKVITLLEGNGEHFFKIAMIKQEIQFCALVMWFNLRKDSTSIWDVWIDSKTSNKIPQQYNFKGQLPLNNLQSGAFREFWCEVLIKHFRFHFCLNLSEVWNLNCTICTSEQNFVSKCLKSSVKTGTAPYNM